MLVSSVRCVPPTWSSVNAVSETLPVGRELKAEEIIFSKFVSPYPLNDKEKELVKENLRICALAKSDPYLFWNEIARLNYLPLAGLGGYDQVKKLVVSESLKIFENPYKYYKAHSTLTLEKRRKLSIDYEQVLIWIENFPIGSQPKNAFPFNELTKLRALLTYIYAQSTPWDKYSFSLPPNGFGLGFDVSLNAWFHTNISRMRRDFESYWESFSKSMQIQHYQQALLELTNSASWTALELKELLENILFRSIQDFAVLGGNEPLRVANPPRCEVKVNDVASLLQPKPSLAPPRNAKGELISFTQGVVPPKLTLHPPRTSDGKEIIFTPSWVATTYNVGGTLVRCFPPPSNAEPAKTAQSVPNFALPPLQHQPV